MTTISNSTRNIFINGEKLNQGSDASKKFGNRVSQLSVHSQLANTGSKGKNSGQCKSRCQTITANTFAVHQNSASPQAINTGINKFALQVISQLVNVIAQLVQQLISEHQNTDTGSDTPSVPTNPSQDNDTTTSPSNPQTPDTCEDINPGHGEPETPSQPDAPDVPDTPDHPDTPDVPDTPDTPTNPDVPTRDVPKAGDTYIRLGPIDKASEKGELSGQDRPNPREISNTVSAQNGEQTSNANNASDLLWSWGQFIDHDMIKTEEGETAANISVPRGDRNFDPAHTGGAFIPFTRSEATTGKDGQREQINTQTALIDGSMVYGATAEKTASLRSYEGGKLKLDENGHLLPDEKDVVLSGDSRAAEQPGLLSLQTLFAREHNRQAGLIADKNPSWSDDKIFNEARRIVSNEIQAITYNEFLPTLLGGEAPVSSRVRYNPATVSGQVSSEFSTAAFRLGHTMVNSTVAYMNKDGGLEQAGLDEVFFRPDFTQTNGIGSILSGQSEQKAQKVDAKIVDELRNRLLGSPDQAGPRLDLVSLNVQRGRDHNLPSYNDMREAIGLHRITSFDDPIFQDGVGQQLAQTYNSPDDIDLWVGGLSEKPFGNSMLGSTFTSIVDEQFARTAIADPNFYSRSASQEEIAYLNNLSLSDIIAANSSYSNVDKTPFIVD